MFKTIILGYNSRAEINNDSWSITSPIKSIKMCLFVFYLQVFEFEPSLFSISFLYSESGAALKSLRSISIYWMYKIGDHGYPFFSFFYSQKKYSEKIVFWLTKDSRLWHWG